MRFSVFYNLCFQILTLMYQVLDLLLVLPEFLHRFVFQIFYDVAADSLAPPVTAEFHE